MTREGSRTGNVIVIVSIVAALYAISIAFRSEVKKKQHSEVHLNFTELTTQNGYLSEEHTVVTEDGYVLRMYRILGGRNCKGGKRSPPVLLMHGLLLSSDVWLDAGPSAGLAYLISDACMDLWVGNCRGNYYSRRHVTLDPDKDSKFWHFSVDEIGRYDVPAMVDYVLDYTSVEKLNYVGFSQGAGTFYIMCSERPEYCEKINVMISLAPAARQTNTRSIAYRILSTYFVMGESALRLTGVEEVLSKGAPLQEFLSFFCQFYWTGKMCNAGAGILDSFHPGSVSNETTKLMFDHFPAGTSLQNMVRYGQSMTTDDFVKFDYGKEKNMKLYGEEVPPKYNLSAVTAPVVVIYGKNDGLVDVQDVKWLVGNLPNVMDVMEVEDPLWNHLDVTYSQYVGELIFPKIFEHLLANSY